MSNHPSTMDDLVLQSTVVKQSSPQPQSESNVDSLPQSLDESGIVFVPPAISPSQLGIMSDDDVTTITGSNTINNTEVETVSQAPFQPDDLVCIGDLTATTAATPPSTTTITTTTTSTDQLKLSIDGQDGVPLEQMPSAVSPQVESIQSNAILPTPSTAATTPVSTTATSTTTAPLPPHANVIEALPTPQQTPPLAATITPAKPTILRASIGKRSFARMDSTNPINDDEVSNDIKRQRGNQPGVISATTTTAATTTTTSTTTSTSSSSTTTTTTTSNTNTNTSSNKILVQQFKELSKNPPTGITVDIDQGNLHRWKVVMLGPPGTPYEGGIFPCTMQFPTDYPAHPPTFSFTPNFPHPNVFADGKVCISILHDPNDSNYQHEPQSERWKPILGVEAILLSVMSLLSEPNTNSPANVEMSKLFRDDQRGYRKKIILAVRKSQEEFMGGQQ